jgi:hypothetical protein
MTAQLEGVGEKLLMGDGGGSIPDRVAVHGDVQR